MTTTATVQGSDVQVGDHLVFLGRTHQVLSLTPYDAERVCLSDPGARIAWSHGGWAMTLLPSQRYAVSRA